MTKKPKATSPEKNTAQAPEPCRWTDEEKRRVTAFFDLLNKWDCEQKKEAENDRPGQN